MKLCAYILDGTPINEVGIYKFDDLLGNAAFQAVDDGESVPSGYQDISSIETWSLYGRKVLSDYKATRSEIKKLYEATTWGSLTTAQKEVVAKYFITQDPSHIVEVFSDSATIESNANHFHECSVISRTARYKAALIHVFNSLAAADRSVIISDIQANSLDIAYREYGVEGTLEGDAEGLFDYLEARTGTAFETTGLAAKSFTPHAGTMQDLANECMQILKDGIY